MSLYTNFLSIPPVQPQDTYIRLDVFTYKWLLDGDVGRAHTPLALSTSYPSFFFLSSFVPLHTYYSVADNQWPLPVLELSFFYTTSIYFDLSTPIYFDLSTPVCFKLSISIYFDLSTPTCFELPTSLYFELSLPICFKLPCPSALSCSHILLDSDLNYLQHPLYSHLSPYCCHIYISIVLYKWHGYQYLLTTTNKSQWCFSGSTSVSI